MITLQAPLSNSPVVEKGFEFPISVELGALIAYPLTSFDQTSNSPSLLLICWMCTFFLLLPKLFCYLIVYCFLRIDRLSPSQEPTGPVQRSVGCADSEFLSRSVLNAV